MKAQVSSEKEKRAEKVKLEEFLKSLKTGLTDLILGISRKAFSGSKLKETNVVIASSVSMNELEQIEVSGEVNIEGIKVYLDNTRLSKLIILNRLFYHL